MNSNPSGNDRTLQCLSTYTAPLSQDNNRVHLARPPKPGFLRPLPHRPHAHDTITQPLVAFFIIIPDRMTYC